jgi:hypothetical protein
MAFGRHSDWARSSRSASPVSVATWLVLVSLVLASSAAIARTDCASMTGVRGELGRVAAVETSGRVGTRAGATQAQRNRPAISVSWTDAQRRTTSTRVAGVAVAATPNIGAGILARHELIALPPPRA